MTGQLKIYLLSICLPRRIRLLCAKEKLKNSRTFKKHSCFITKRKQCTISYEKSVIYYIP